MSDLRPIGSEKLPIEDKIKRIMEIARYGETPKNTDYHIKTTEYQKKAADGMTYAVVKEKDGYYIKSGLNEGLLDYADGIANKKKNRFRSYSSAIKRINLILKPINEQYNGGYGDPVFEQDEGGEEKFVLKVDTPDEEIDMGDEEIDMGDEEIDMGDEEMDTEDDMDLEDDMEDDMEDEMDIEDDEMETELDTDIPSMKSIQKLTGKLGQKLRDAEEELDSESIKYVLNSVISAVNIENLDDEDMEDIMDRFEIDEDEYGMEDDIEITDDEFGGEEDVDMGDEEMEMGDEEMEMGDEDIEVEDEEIQLEDEDPMTESISKKVNKTLKKYFKQSKNEKVLKENRTKKYIKSKIHESKNIRQIKKVSKSIEQELKATYIIKENKNLTFLGSTKKGTLVFDNNNHRIGVTPRGKVIR